MNEAVKVPDIIGKWDCPFPHDKKTWPTCANDFQGVGTTLGESLESGKQTIHDNNPEKGSAPDKVPKPSADKNMPSLYNIPRPIALGGLEPPDLPLICAAHHLIPAQASLRGSKVVKYLYQGSAKFNAPGKKGKTVTKGGGKLEANVGYDVNGSQNGVWLPGPYALRKKKGKKLAGPRVRTLRRKKRTVLAEMIEDPEAEDVVDETKGGEEPDGTKSLQELRVSYYLLYSIAAMLHVKAQYHDAHGKYSKFVLKCLNAIATELNDLAYKGLCDECPKRKKGDKLPPPYELVNRLNDVSNRLKSFLSGPPGGWRPNVWTSSMSVEFGKKDVMGVQLASIESSPEET